MGGKYKIDIEAMEWESMDWDIQLRGCCEHVSSWSKLRAQLSVTSAL